MSDKEIGEDERESVEEIEEEARTFFTFLCDKEKLEYT